MKIILIYFVLLTFYLDQVLGAIGWVRGLSLLNLNIYLLLIVWLFAIARRRRIFIPSQLSKFIALFGFWLLISIFVKILRAEIPNVSILSELLSLKKWFDPILLFFCLLNIVDDEETCNQTLFAMCFLFLALILTQLGATYGITGYMTGTIDQHGGRAGGFSAPGVYAISLTLFFPFALSGSFLTKRSSMFKFCYMILAFLILVGIVNAGSRNGVVSFLVSFLVYLLILKRQKLLGMLSLIFLIIGMFVVGTTAFFVSPTSVKMELSDRIDPSSSANLNEYTSGRMEIWKNGLRLFVDNPLIGHGRHSFVILSQLRGYRKIDAPHNEYLRYLVELGIIGLIAFLLIFYKIFKDIWHSLKKTTDPWAKQLYISYIAGLCGYMAGMFATNVGPSFFLFWIYTAVVYRYSQLDMDKIGVSVFKNESMITQSAALQK